LTSWPARQVLLPRLAGKLFFVPFFVVHYGMFWIGHGIFLQTFFGEGVRGFPGGSQNFFLGPIMEGLMRAEVLVWPLVAMLVSHGVSFVSNFLASGEFRIAAIGELMMRPYGRVVILHVTIVLGGFMAVLLGPSLGLQLLVDARSARA